MAEATDLPVLSFNGTNHPYLAKTSMTARRYLTPRLNLENACISTKSAAHILSIPLTKTLRFFYFLLIGLCNSSANVEAFFYQHPTQNVLLFLLKRKRDRVPFFP